MQKIIRDIIAQNFKDEKPHFQIHKGIAIRFGLASWAIIKQYFKKKSNNDKEHYYSKRKFLREPTRRRVVSVERRTKNFFIFKGFFKINK